MKLLSSMLVWLTCLVLVVYSLALVIDLTLLNPAVLERELVSDQLTDSITADFGQQKLLEMGQFSNALAPSQLTPDGPEVGQQLSQLLAELPTFLKAGGDIPSFDLMGGEPTPVPAAWSSRAAAISDIRRVGPLVIMALLVAVVVLGRQARFRLLRQTFLRAGLILAVVGLLWLALGAAGAGFAGGQLKDQAIARVLPDALRSLGTQAARATWVAAAVHLILALIMAIIGLVVSRRHLRPDKSAGSASKGPRPARNPRVGLT